VTQALLPVEVKQQPWTAVRPRLRDVARGAQPPRLWIAPCNLSTLAARVGNPSPVGLALATLLPLIYSCFRFWVRLIRAKYQVPIALFHWAENSCSG